MWQKYVHPRENNKKYKTQIPLLHRHDENISEKIQMLNIEKLKIDRFLKTQTQTNIMVQTIFAVISTQ